MEALRVRIPATFDLADPAPVDVRWIAVLLVASDHTTFAADALGHVEVEAILFTGLEGALRNLRRGNFEIHSAVSYRCCGRAPFRSKHEGRALFLGSLQ